MGKIKMIDVEGVSMCYQADSSGESMPGRGDSTC